MEYTIKKLAKLAGISVRTLHFYDEKGILKPAGVKANGYRVYGEKELLTLQQIMFFKELEFSLEQIQEILKTPGFDRLKALREQQKLLSIKRDRLTDLLATIAKTIRSGQGGESMKNDDLYDGFTKKQMEEYKEEAKKRWGHTDAYKQSVERTKHWTKADYDRIAKQGVEWTKKLAALRETGLSAESPQVQEMIVQHYNALRTFYEPNYEMYRGLGELYVNDPRFTAYYDKHGEGLAAFMRDAMIFFVEKKSKQ
jgi:MerR family transcriptional regulator, thiopeptide resistance regulator